MKLIFPAFISVIGLAPLSQGQWMAERHPYYDAACLNVAQNRPAATCLAVSPAADTRLTVSENKAEAGAGGHVLLQGWRGERCSTQLAISGNGPISQLTVSCAGVSMKDKTLPVSVSMLRYTKAHGTATADIIDHASRCDTPDGVERGVWVQVDIPGDAEPGVYRGAICISAAGCAEIRQEVVLEVEDEELPAPDKWKMHLDLWQHPQAVARWHDVEPWSEEHFALMRPLMKRLAEAGQKCITCTILDEAWNGQTYDWFPGMVRWTRKANGQMVYDYTDLDKWIAFMYDEIGIREQISCYTMIPWHLSVKFFDEATGHFDAIKATPGTPEYDALWAPFLKDFYRHMQQKGWAEKTCIAIDERPDAYVRAAMKLVKENAPGFRIASAVDRPSGLTREVYNISPVITHAGSALGELLKERRKAGKITTFYVCLHPAKPNTFTHSEPAQAEWLGLFAAANNLDGFLRWAYNSWNLNPFETTDFGKWPSGDCFLVYPGNRSSIRFERLRDGIENYEKVQILRARASESPAAAETIRRMDEQLAAIFTVERSKGDAHTDDVYRARRIIGQTLRQLNAQK